MRFRPRGLITIINYHQPHRDTFEAHMRELAKWYQFASIDFTKSYGSSRHPLVVTLDDGYMSNYQLMKTISKYVIPAVIYVVAGLVDTNRRFWFDMLPHNSIAMRELKTAIDADRISILKKRYGYTHEMEFDRRTVLNSSEIRDMQKVGCTIASHSLTHPIFTRCPEDKIQHELRGSRELLSRILGKSINDFAYPAGYWGKEISESTMDAGYSSSRTTQPGRYRHGDNVFGLPCFGIADDAGPGKALLQASGLWGKYRRILKSVVTSR